MRETIIRVLVKILKVIFKIVLIIALYIALQMYKEHQSQWSRSMRMRIEALERTGH